MFSCFSGKDLASLRISQHILWYRQKSMRKTNIDGKQKEEKEIEMRRSRKVREWRTSLDKCILNMLQLDQLQIVILTRRLLG